MTMAYILFVNPDILSAAECPWPGDDSHSGISWLDNYSHGLATNYPLP